MRRPRVCTQGYRLVVEEARRRPCRSVVSAPVRVSVMVFDAVWLISISVPTGLSLLRYAPFHIIVNVPRLILVYY